MRFALIAGALLVAWMVCRVSKLRQYFAAQLGAAMLIEAALLRYDEHSIIYVWAFVVANLYVFAAMVPLTWRTLNFHPVRLIAVLNGLAAGVGLWFISAAGKTMSLYELIGSIEGSFLTLCAVCAGMGAAYLRGTDRKIAMSLMVFWFAQALYEFGFTLHIDSPNWLMVNEFLPTAIVASGCLWLGLFCRKEVAA